MNIRFVVLLILTLFIFVPVSRWSTTKASFPPSAQLTFDAPLQQNITSDLYSLYPAARDHIRSAGAHWLTYLDYSIGTIIVAYPGYLDFGPKLSNALAVYFAASPRGIVVLAPAFGGHDLYFEPSWSLWLAATLIHEATHDKQYRRGEEFTSSSSCRHEVEAVAKASAFLSDIPGRFYSYIASYYRTRIQEVNRTRCP